jgi:hypothetical protein
VGLFVQGKGSVDTFQRQGRTAGRVVFYVVRVVSKESERIVLLTASRGNLTLFFVVTVDHREDFIAFSRRENGTSHPQALFAIRKVEWLTHAYVVTTNNIILYSTKDRNATERVGLLIFNSLNEMRRKSEA